nr:protein kinase, ATP binding site-containing protein [Tanacetum cinerariifolium]
SGMLVYHNRSIGDGQPQNLTNLVRHYYDDGLESLIDPSIRDHIADRSFRVFMEIAFKCISFNLKFAFFGRREEWKWSEVVDFGLQPWRVLGTTTVYENLSLAATLALADVGVSMLWAAQQNLNLGSLRLYLAL